MTSLNNFMRGLIQLRREMPFGLLIMIPVLILMTPFIMLALIVSLVVGTEDNLS